MKWPPSPAGRAPSLAQGAPQAGPSRQGRCPRCPKNHPREAGAICSQDLKWSLYTKRYWDQSPHVQEPEGHQAQGQLGFLSREDLLCLPANSSFMAALAEISAASSTASWTCQEDGLSSFEWPICKVQQPPPAEDQCGLSPMGPELLQQGSKQVGCGSSSALLPTRLGAARGHGEKGWLCVPGTERHYQLRVWQEELAGCATTKTRTNLLAAFSGATERAP